MSNQPTHTRELVMCDDCIGYCDRAEAEIDYQSGDDLIDCCVSMWGAGRLWRCRHAGALVWMRDETEKRCPRCRVKPR